MACTAGPRHSVLCCLAGVHGRQTAAVPPLPAGSPILQECTALHMAAANGHSRVVRTLLAAGASPWKAGVGGMLPLHMAAIKCQLAAVRLLLDAAPGTAAARDQYGRCALHYAAEVGPPALVRLLLAVAPQAALVKAHRDEFPLFMAAREGRDHIVCGGRVAEGSSGLNKYSLHQQACFSCNKLAWLPLPSCTPCCCIAKRSCLAWWLLQGGLIAVAARSMWLAALRRQVADLHISHGSKRR